MKLWNHFNSWAPTVAWASLIFYLSSIPSLDTGWGIGDLILRKGAHVFEFGVLTLLLLRAFRRTWTQLTAKKTIVLSFLFAFFYAISDEYHQRFVPGRGPAMMDVLIDLFGILLALALIYKRMFSSKTNAMAVSLCVILLTGCGPQSEFNKAKKLEEKKRYGDAWTRYQNFVARNPKHAKAPEALFRAGWMAQVGMDDCYVAQTFYEQVITRYPQSEPWAQAASFQMQNCPDYYPLIPGSKWEEGDSDSKGQLARTVIECEPLKSSKALFPSEGAKLIRTYYAGDKKFRTSEFIYRKEKGQVAEFSNEKDHISKILLRWPIQVGTTWKTKVDDRVFRYEIVSLEEKVKVQAGEFLNCIKIWSTFEGARVGSQYEYYAPGVGRALTTQSAGQAGDEKRLTELLTYEIAPLPDFALEDQKK